MRKLSRASAQAGTNATPQMVAMHYAAPELAKYFTGTDASFLQELTHKAQPIADQLEPSASIPSDIECAIAEKAYKKLKKMESIWGMSGIITMSIVCGIWFSHSIEGMAWLGYLLPFLGPGIIAYMPFSSVGAEIARSSAEYKSSLTIAARILASEREKTNYWKNLHWRELEHRVAALFVRKGYRAYATPGSGDKGVDVVAESAQEKLVIQCKQYSKPAQRNVVSELLGVQAAEKADRSILICTGGFTKGAEDYARENGIILWDLDDLAQENTKFNG